ncbi:hypothetical protein [Actinomadura harenae]|nr:hypothetical protein [Actinomadura harenae]
MTTIIHPRGGVRRQNGSASGSESSPGGVSGVSGGRDSTGIDRNAGRTAE